MQPLVKDRTVRQQRRAWSLLTGENKKCHKGGECEDVEEKDKKRCTFGKFREQGWFHFTEIREGMGLDQKRPSLISKSRILSNGHGI